MATKLAFLFTDSAGQTGNGVALSIGGDVGHVYANAASMHAVGTRALTRGNGVLAEAVRWLGPNGQRVFLASYDEDVDLIRASSSVPLGHATAELSAAHIEDELDRASILAFTDDPFDKDEIDADLVAVLA